MIIEKFGGSSMADPELVLERVNEQDDLSTIVVVSAPGIDHENPIKLTDLLLDYKFQRTLDRKAAILERVSNFAIKANIPDISGYTAQAAEEIDTYTANGWPVEALGELWSARVFSTLSQRELIDPLDVIHFNPDGTLNVANSCVALKSQVDPDERYVMPGFYGAIDSRNVHVFERGGSDISGAIAALAMNADAYRNWSDVAGFMSADPRKVDRGTRLLPVITYREAYELAINGCELLHRDVASLLHYTGIPTIMCETATGKRGTVVCTERSWENSPIAGVTGSISEQQDKGMLHIVGEGLAKCATIRSQVADDLINALCSIGIAEHALEDDSSLAGITVRVPIEHFNTSLKTVHEKVVVI